MRLSRRQFLHFVAGAVAVPTLGQIARAETFPARPVTLVVPWPAGGSTDVTLRALGAASEKHLGQSVVIENRPGASGTLGPAQMAATAKPDGYTVSQIPIGIFRAPFLRPMAYDPSTDFTYIIGVSGYTFGLVVKKDARWKTFQEFLADAKANPGKITYATQGAGTTPHITMELIAKQLGITLVPVPFKGGADGINALLGGHVDAQVDSSGWGPQVNAGQLRLLVTWGATRTESWPTVPTLKETGIDMVVNSPYGIAGPKGMDANVARVLHDAFKKGMEESSFRAVLAKFDQEAWYLSSRDYEKYVLREIAEQKRIVEVLGLKQE